MDCREVICAYFSPTGGTKKTACQIAAALGKELRKPVTKMDFTLPEMRKDVMAFCPDQLVLFALPVYAGRLPNVLLSWLNTMEGNGALAAAVVVYGNREYDDALIEWPGLFAAKGIRLVGAGAFVAEHAFFTTLAGGRSRKEDQ